MVKEKIREILSNYVEISDKGFENFYAFYSKLPYFSENMAVRRDNVLLVYVFMVLSNVQYKKEGTYGNSWEKRGELEVFFNVARKFDRLENIMLKGATDEVGESHADTVADLANYGLLWMTYILREKPELFFNWLENNL